jgi:serine/threonine protein kinase
MSVGCTLSKKLQTGLDFEDISRYYFLNPAMNNSSEAQSDSELQDLCLDDKFRIDELLGEGGVGKVYRATNLLLDREVAIKVLRPEFEGNPELVKRFLSEARAANRVRHPNVVDVTDVGTSQRGTPYIVQELLRGETLAQHLERKGRLGTQATLERVYPVIAAVAFAHSKGLIHRDVKPENIFLARVGEQVIPKIVDFGISKVLAADPSVQVTQAGTVMGTPAYMPPEQFHAFHDADARSDVWAFGVLLYECLAGRPPFAADNARALFTEICTLQPPPLSAMDSDIPPEFETIVMRCLEKNPTSRYADAGELCNAMKMFMTESDTYKIILDYDGTYVASQSLIPPPLGKKAKSTSRPWSGVRLSDSPKSGTPATGAPRAHGTLAFGTTPASQEAISMSHRAGHVSVRTNVPTPTNRAVTPGAGYRRLMHTTHAEQLSKSSFPVSEPASAATTTQGVSVQTAAPPPPPAATSSLRYVGIGVVVAIAALALGARTASQRSNTGSNQPPVVAPVAAAVSARTEHVQFALTSNASNAEALFRGRTYPVPFEVDVEASNTEETIRVSAPGHIARQLNVSLSNPVRLSIFLTAETPPVGATAPTPVAVQIPLAIETERDSAGHHHARTAPGVRDAAVVATAITATTVQAVAPVPVPTPASTPTVAQVANTPAPVAAPTPPTPTTQAAVPQAAQGPDMAGIQRAIRSHRGAISACVDRERAENPLLAGQISIQLRIASNGQVASARVHGDGSSSLASCISSDASGWSFAPTNQSQPLEINVPVHLD